MAVKTNIAEAGAQLAPISDSPKSTFSFKQIHRIVNDLSPVVYAVEQVIEVGDLVLVMGKPKSAKSLVVIDLGIRIALGIDWCGRNVKKGAVIYIAGEGHRGIRRRLMAWALVNGHDIPSDTPFFVSEMSAQFLDKDSFAQVVQAIKTIEENIDLPISMIVVDTVARNFGPGNESFPADMSLFVGQMDKLKNIFQCSLVVIHHTSYADETRARGASSLPGAVDLSLLAKKEREGEEEFVTVSGKEQKDIAEFDPLVFKIQPIELGIRTETGDPVTSVAVIQSDHASATTTGSSQNLGKNQRALLFLLQKMYEKHRKTLADSELDQCGARVLYADWRSKSELNSKAFYNAKQGLIERDLISIEKDYVFLNVE